MVLAAMPETIIQNIFSGIGSVIFTEIKYPKHFFRSEYFLWAMVDHKLPTSKSECYESDLPASFSAKFGETIKRTPPQATKKNKAVSRGLVADEVKPCHV